MIREEGEVHARAWECPTPLGHRIHVHVRTCMYTHVQYSEKQRLLKNDMAETELPGVTLNQEYRVKLGKSFTFPKENAFHTIKCKSRFLVFLLYLMPISRNGYI